MPNKLAEFMFDRIGIPKFGKYLDLASFRHKLVSSNIANASTPGYQRKDIDFQAEFEKLTGKTSHLAGFVTHQNHIPLGQSEARPPKVHEARIEDGDLNSVDIDVEVSTMAKNELLFSVGAQLLQRKIEGLKNVIKSK